MLAETIVDNEYATLTYHPQTRILHNQLKKLPPVETMKDLLNKACEAMKSHHATKFLTDARNSATLPKEFDEWRQNDWLPRMVSAGWKFWAPVFPVSTITKMHIQRFSQGFEAVGVKVHPCADPAEGITWLISQ